MSSFYRMTKNPDTGTYENAFWLDDYFGKHRYGVKFPSSGKVFYADKHDWEILDEYHSNDYEGNI